MHYTNDKEDKSNFFNKDFHLDAGVHDLEILQEEPTSFSMRFNARLQKLAVNTGCSPEKSGRKCSQNYPPRPSGKSDPQMDRRTAPRTLLVLLPNQVMVAYDSASGQILKAWKSALVNQTPSLDSRSQKQSAAKGQEIPGATSTVLQGNEFNLLHYETQGRFRADLFPGRRGQSELHGLPPGSGFLHRNFAIETSFSIFHENDF